MSEQDKPGFSVALKTAFNTNPDYFAWWYTVKSVALCGAVAAFAYMLGREHGRRRR